MFILQIILSRAGTGRRIFLRSEIAFQDLDECMYVILKDTLDYLEETPGEIDSATEDAFAYYKDLHTKRQGN